MGINSQPLVALGIRTDYQAPDILGNEAKLSALRGQQQQQMIQAQQAPLALQQMQQENQMREQQLKDQQAQTAAMQEWDGKDMMELPGLVMKHGGSAQTVLGMKSAITKQRSELATADKTVLESESYKNNLLLGQLDVLKQLPDEAIGSALTQALPTLVQNKLLDPQHAQSIGQLASQQDPKTLRQSLDLFEKGLMGHKEQLEQASKAQADAIAKQEAEQKAAMAPSQLAASQSDAQLKQMEVAQGGANGTGADARYRNLQALLSQKKQISPDDQAFIKGYEKQKLLVPATTANIRMEGLAQAREYPVFDSRDKSTKYVSAEEINRAQREEPNRYTVASFTPEAIVPKEMAQGTKQIIKPLTAFNTAIQHLDTLERLADGLGNSDLRIFNRAKQEWASQTGNAAPANFAAAKNAMSGEVAQALKASGSTDKEIEAVGNSFDRAQSPAQLKGSINTYRELLKSKSEQLKKQYTSALGGKPAFDQQSGAPKVGDIKVFPNGNKGKWDGKGYVLTTGQ